MTRIDLSEFARERQAGRRIGITSICTAHPIVIEAALMEGREMGTNVLIEATCNQVNQEGGYTGMTPADFRRFVVDIADRVNFDRSKLILGGDHLGPNPWKHLAADEAMNRARVLIEAYSRAGYTKLHLDASMGCRGESVALSDEMTAERAASLASVAEAAVDPDGPKPVYVIGTEVPTPGGALEEIKGIEVTTPDAVLRTVEIHRKEFAAAGVATAFDRAIAVVVQPGVEFGNANVVVYDQPKAQALSATLSRMPQLVFEAHSTDYQPAAALCALVDDGFAILKVGPWLTFALREVLYGLDCIAQVLAPSSSSESLSSAMEDLMIRKPDNWSNHYHGDTTELRVQRHFSYSDRIRYYWPHRDAQAAVRRLEERLGGERIPETLVSQYLAPLYPSVAAGRVKARPRDLQIAGVRAVLAVYGQACLDR